MREWVADGVAEGFMPADSMGVRARSVGLKLRLRLSLNVISDDRDKKP